MTTTAAKSKRNHQLTVTEVSQRFQHRQALLQQACLWYKHSDMFHRITPQRMTLQSDWPARNSNLLYCPIQKTGSTTWFEIVREARKERESVQPPSKHREENKQNNDTVNFLFVREPYSRLLSGYVDKIFSPNTMFWESTGTYIVRKYRSDPSDITFRCGHDVTFEEYIRYVVDSQKTLQHRNAHFIPSHGHCNLCNVNYSYSGHLETLRDDMGFLLKTFHLPGKHAKMNFDKVTIIDNSGWVISIMKTKIRKCMIMHEACLRLWKKFLIRGIINKDEPLPVTAEEAQTISLEEFVNRTLKALRRSGNTRETRLQRTEALRQAFGSLSLDLRLQVQKMLTLDFALFGFDPRPDFLFPSASELRGGNYRYFDLSEAKKDLDLEVFW